jgi:predicted Ser/Thr protein kinase
LVLFRTESSTKENEIVSRSLSQSGSKYSQISFKELVVGEKLGRGSYGKVYLGKWNTASVALKFCRKNESTMEVFIRETQLMM